MALPPRRSPGRLLEVAIGALNGLVGDHLARTGNGLATPTTLVHAGEPIPPRDLPRVLPAPSRRAALFVHGTACTEDVWLMPCGGDYGAWLARDLGVTPLYVRYNSGRPIPDTGADLDALLGALVAAYPGPLDELLLVGYSMGGLVIRSACHAASIGGSRWLGQVRRAIYVGTPHLGAPLERAGRVLTRVLSAIDDPYTRLAAQLGDLRSDGVKDLGDADLRHEDRARRRPTISLRDPSHPVPLLPSIRHFLVAGTLSSDPRLAALFGDSLVPVPSGTDGACVAPGLPPLPPAHVRVLPGLGHLALAHHPDVYAHLRSWCEEEIP